MNTHVRRCHKEAEFIDRIQRAMNKPLGQVQCHIVDQTGMAQVMGTAGWSKNEALGVVGFQLGNNVYVLGSAPWTVLHELVHRSGVNADRISRFVAEGLTEAIARELKRAPDEHKPTYPKETHWVQTRLLPRLNMSAVELGRKLAHSSDPPATLADLMVAVDPQLDRSKLLRQLQPQVPDQPSFNRRGHRTRQPPSPERRQRRSPPAVPSAPPSPPQSSLRDDSGGTALVAGLLLLSGAALALPIAAEHWRQSSSPGTR
jgi:hypothetical protein